FHHPPAFLEDLLAFGAVIDFDLGGEVDAPRRGAARRTGSRRYAYAAAAAGGGGSSSRASGGIATGGAAGDCNRVEVRALAVVQGAAVRGELQGRETAAAKAAAGWRTVFLARAGARLRDARQALAGDVNGPQRLHGPAALGA